MRVRALHLLATAALVATTIAAAPTAPLKDAQGPVDTALQAALTAAGVCDDLDERLCLLPFPNDHFTVLDASTPTGRRVDLNTLATPRTLAGKPVDTSEWNRNDGFSPGALILTYVPGLDLARTYGLDGTPETGAGTPNDPFAVRDDVADAIIEDPALSMAADSPIVLLNADTGERHPFYAELDEHPETLADGEDRTLIVRPLVNLTEGDRYIVALRDLVDADGNELAPTAAFTALRDALAVPAAGDKKNCEDHPGKGGGNGKGKGGDHKCVDEGGQVPFPAEADIDPADKDGRYADIFTRLAATGVDTTDLYLAWDFHVASAENLAGRALAIRDDAFAQLGDTVLDDGEIQGSSPTFAVTEWADGESDGYPMRIVRGTVTVPNYLDRPQEGVNGEAAGNAETVYDQLPAELRDNDPFVGEGLDLADEVPVIIPQSRFFYGEALPGPMAEPVQNPAVPTTEAEFVCRFRTDLAGDKAPSDPSNGTTLAKPTLYGHGLLGGMGEAEGSSTSDLRRAGHAMCGVDWIGMATEDITNVALILNDISFFPSLADRAQQGFLNFQYVGRALIHEDGLGTHEAFQVGGQSVLDTSELFYNGNSQGGIMGGALTALAVDFTKSVLGVPGMNYSTLLNRSVDWEGEFIDPSNPDIPAYASFMYNMYPDKVEQQLVFSLIQMLWDRAEANGYAAHMTSNPYPNTPAHQVILEVALGDYQVTNISAEVEARTIGADFLGSALADGRHWERAYATGATATPYGFSDFATLEDGTVYAPSGSAIVYWDSGNPLPFNGNVPPAYLGQDPHSDPRKDDRALIQKVTFYDTGVIVDVMNGQPYWNQNCRHGEYHPAC